MVEQTAKQYTEMAEKCLVVFRDKMQDYGTAWEIFRAPSLTDQIAIKARRIRAVQLKGKQKVNEDIPDEFMGIINYSAMAIIQSERGFRDVPDLKAEEAIEAYLEVIERAKSLMGDKNHDYDEAWRQMRVSSITDIILVKLHRIKEIENRQGKTKVSEGSIPNFLDIINYAFFALILLETPSKG